MASVGVTNGFRQSPARTAPALHRLAGVSADPLLALFHENWLASCGAIYRTADVGPPFFADLPAYLEWTTLAFELATAGKRIVALDTPTFRINETDGSLSRSRAYERHALNALHRMLARSSRSDIRRLIKRRIAQGWHSCSDQALKAGEGREALRCHLMSLRHAPGWRYLPYSRHLLPLLARQPASARQSS
jgi:hypothetical protein